MSEIRVNTITDGEGTGSPEFPFGVNISDGSIDNVAIGANTPSTGNFTNLEYEGTLTGGTGVVNLGDGQVVKDAAGNVGIGTTSPAFALELLTNSNFAFSGTGRRTAAFTSTSAAVADQPGIQLGYDTAGAGIVAAATNSAGQPLAFWTYNGSSWAEKMRIDPNGRVTKPHQPAFYAVVSGGLSPGFSSGTVIPYSSVITNIGSHYNPSNYRFTAPVSGNYFFSANCSPGNASSNNRWVAIIIRKNGSPVSPSLYGGLGHVSVINDNQYDTVSQSIILNLSQNDYVDARIDYNTFNGNLGFGNFCGYLLG